jgi:hypothetical protein
VKQSARLVPPFCLKNGNEINLSGLQAAKVGVGFAIGNVADPTGLVRG